VFIEVADRDTLGQEAHEAISRADATCGSVVARDARQRHDHVLRSAHGRHRDREHERRDRLVAAGQRLDHTAPLARRAATSGAVSAVAFESPLAPNLD
jgi:hypothetical protein